jgi:hypothetical protein
MRDTHKIISTGPTGDAYTPSRAAGTPRRTPRAGVLGQPMKPFFIVSCTLFFVFCFLFFFAFSKSKQFLYLNNFKFQIFQYLHFFKN